MDLRKQANNQIQRVPRYGETVRKKFEIFVFFGAFHCKNEESSQF